MGLRVQVEGPVFVQLGLGLELGVVPGEYGLFWTCGDCWELSAGRVSLIWEPPDQRSGVCSWCGRRYSFGSRYGWEELAKELGMDVEEMRGERPWMNPPTVEEREEAGL